MAENISLFNLKMPVNTLHLKFLEFYKSEQLFDVRFVCANQVTVRAHKMVLCSLSTTLEKMFKELPECVQDNIVVHLPDVDASGLRLLLESLYNGGIKITRRQYCEVLEITEMFGLGTQFTNSPTVTDPSGNSTLFNPVWDSCNLPPIPAPRKIRRASSQLCLNQNQPPFQNVITETSKEKPPATTVTSTASSQAQTQYFMGQMNQVSCVPLLGEQSTVERQSTVGQSTVPDCPELIEINYDLPPAPVCRPSDSRYFATPDESMCLLPLIQAPFPTTANTFPTQHAFRNQIPQSLANITGLPNYQFMLSQQANYNYSTPEKPQPLPRVSVQSSSSVPSPQPTARNCGGFGTSHIKSIEVIEISDEEEGEPKMTCHPSKDPDQIARNEDIAFNKLKTYLSSMNKTSVVSNINSNLLSENKNSSTESSSLQKKYDIKNLCERSSFGKDSNESSSEDATTLLCSSSSKNEISSRVLNTNQNQMSLISGSCAESSYGINYIDHTNLTPTGSNDDTSLERVSLPNQPCLPLSNIDNSKVNVKLISSSNQTAETGGLPIECASLHNRIGNANLSTNHGKNSFECFSSNVEIFTSPSVDSKMNESQVKSVKRSQNDDEPFPSDAKKKKNLLVQKKCKLSAEVAAVVGKNVSTREEVCRALWKYIKDHNLINDNVTESRREVSCDKVLFEIFKQAHIYTQILWSFSHCNTDQIKEI